MSFVNKIKGWGQRASDTDHALDGDVAVADDYRPRRAATAHASTDVPLGDTDAGAAFDAMPQAGEGTPQTSSIISEAVPSGIADFTETRLQDADSTVMPLGTALPLIGDRPAAEQQRILLAMLALGLVGLIVLTILAFVAAGRGSAQVAGKRPGADAVAAAGQVGVAGADRATPAAFPEVKESAEVLAANVRSLKTGEGSVRRCAVGRAGCDSTALLPLVDRAEKNAGIVSPSRSR